MSKKKSGKILEGGRSWRPLRRSTSWTFRIIVKGRAALRRNGTRPGRGLSSGVDEGGRFPAYREGGSEKRATIACPLTVIRLKTRRVLKR